MSSNTDILDEVANLKAGGKPFALATVIRTISVTAAKAGAKAIISSDGTISSGWIGGGCARAAVLNAARQAISDGEPRMVSIQPEDLLKDAGVEAGETKAGIRYARNMCPSQGTMDVFVEPVLPKPALLIFGASPVAHAVSQVGSRYDFDCIVVAAQEHHGSFPDSCALMDTVEPDQFQARPVYIVVSTQGNGDEKALTAALEIDAAYVGFVGSRRKADSLRAKLTEKGMKADCLDRIIAPAGLDIGAILPDEIALSILAQIIQVRRRDQRDLEGTTQKSQIQE